MYWECQLSKSCSTSAIRAARQIGAEVANVCVTADYPRYRADCLSTLGREPIEWISIREYRSVSWKFASDAIVELRRRRAFPIELAGYKRV
jgi:hypothetical protein